MSEDNEYRKLYIYGYLYSLSRIENPLSARVVNYMFRYTAQYIMQITSQNYNIQHFTF